MSWIDLESNFYHRLLKFIILFDEETSSTIDDFLTLNFNGFSLNTFLIVAKLIAIISNLTYKRI